MRAKVQLLYFPDCPNLEAARASVRRACEATGISHEEVDVTAPETPPQLRDWGSPTVLVDGVDVAGADSPTGKACRLYPGEPHNAPSVEMIRRAIALSG